MLMNITSNVNKTKTKNVLYVKVKHWIFNAFSVSVSFFLRSAAREESPLTFFVKMES